jgi:hypothetical protein
MGQECTAFACQVHASAQQVSGSAHLGRIDIGLREHPAAQQKGDFMGINLVVFGLATMDGLHIEGMTEDKWDTLFSTEVGQPVPGEHTFGSHDEPIAVGGDGLEKCLRGRFHVPVQQRLTGLVEDTHVHGAGMQIDAAVKLMLCG